MLRYSSIGIARLLRDYGQPNLTSWIQLPAFSPSMASYLFGRCVLVGCVGYLVWVLQQKSVYSPNYLDSVCANAPGHNLCDTFSGNPRFAAYTFTAQLYLLTYCTPPWRTRWAYHPRRRAGHLRRYRLTTTDYHNLATNRGRSRFHSWRADNCASTPASTTATATTNATLCAIACGSGYSLTPLTRCLPCDPPTRSTSHRLIQPPKPSLACVLSSRRC